MPITMPNYLSDLPQTQRLPISILRDAAEELRRATNGLVGGTVSTLNPGEGSLFRYTFYLLVPSLNDYTDPIFYAWHDTHFYPVTVLVAGGQQGKDDFVCSDDNAFEQELGRIFASDDTKSRIQAMIALAQK